jgi:NAD(P)H-hydrate epimerase
MMKLVTVAEMGAIEQEANTGGLTFADMMENAGQGLGQWVSNKFRDGGSVVGLVGSGNNGGDTLLALDFLSRKGWNTCAYLVRPRPDDDPLMVRGKETATVFIKPGEDEDLAQLERQLSKADILLDGVLGTGIQLPLKPELARTLGNIKLLISKQTHPIHVIAVDCPSGVDCENGETAPECIPAETTICMAAVKMGLLQFPAFLYVGRIETVDIDLSETLKSSTKIQRWVVDKESVRVRLPERRLDAHKGTFGTAMVAAGSINYTGAALLSGKAAYRVGAGLVTMAIPEMIYSAIAGQFPEATWLILPHEMGVISEKAAEVLREHSRRVTALLLGPGWGLEDTTLNFLKRLASVGDNKRRNSSMGFLVPPAANKPDSSDLPPLVVDADGLKLLARIPDWQNLIPRQTILTPHPGEMSVLCGLPVEVIQRDRIGTAERFAHEWGQVVVLKGACTVIADPGGKTAVIPVATPALARAGTGDVLSGMITGLRAQGMDAFEAAFSGAWIHAQAGLKAAEQLGNTASVLAGDVLQAVIGVMSELGV